MSSSADSPASPPADRIQASSSRTSKWSSTFGAAALGGAIADILTYPADALSTLLQSRRFPTDFAGLYRGYWAMAIFGTPAYAAYFGSYDYLKDSHGINPVVAGCVAELSGGIFFVPAEILKKRAVLRQKGYTQASEIPRTIVNVLRKEGLRGFYVGYVASVATWMPFSGIYFGAFEKSKQYLPEKPWTDLAAGAIAGSFAAVVTSPIDMVATRVQTRYNGATTAPAVVADILKENNYRPHNVGSAMFKAAPGRVLWLAPHAAISIAGFQYFKSRFRSDE